MKYISEKALWQAKNLDLNESLSRLYNQFIDWLVFFKEKQISIKYIAYVMKLSERQVQRLINILVERGLLYKKQIGGQRARNTYSLNREIFKYAKYYQEVFPALKKFIFNVLGWVFGKDVTLYKKNKDIYNQNSKTVANHSSVHPNLFLNSCKWSSTVDRQWSTGYQQSVFYVNQEYERSIPDDHQLQNFQKVLDEVFKPKEKCVKEQLFWDGLTKVLKLNEHGKLKIQVFPVRIVNAAYKKLQQQNKVHDKVKWLIRECDNQCKNDGIRPAWGKYYDGIRTLNIDQNDPLIETGDDQIDMFDFSKPKAMIEPQVYSTRDLSKHKIAPEVEKVRKGLQFIGNMMSPEIYNEIQEWLDQQPQS